MPADSIAVLIDLPPPWIEDRPHADRFHEQHVAQAAVDGSGSSSGTAAELDDDVPIAELANPAEGFDENAGLANGFVH